jgi:hypothetical protein
MKLMKRKKVDSKTEACNLIKQYMIVLFLLAIQREFICIRFGMLFSKFKQSKI